MFVNNASRSLFFCQKQINLLLILAILIKTKDEQLWWQTISRSIFAQEELKNNCQWWRHASQVARLGVGPSRDIHCGKDADATVDVTENLTSNSGGKLLVVNGIMHQKDRIMETAVHNNLKWRVANRNK